MDSISSPEVGAENAVAASLAYTAALVIAILIGGHYYYQNCFKYFQRLGLKNPKPWPLVGNMWTMLREDRMKTEQMWARTCGKFYGIFQGTRPRFVVADNELIRQICIKDFDVFPNHELLELANEYQRRFIFFAQDDTWKHMRAIQTPTFTSGKIKRMYKLLNQCADDLVQCFDEQLEATPNGVPSVVVNVKDIYSLFTMDAIASCGYGLKMERARGSASLKAASGRNELVRLALKLFEFNLARMLVFFVFPVKLLKMIKFRLSPARNIEGLAERVRHIISARRRHLADNRKFDDYLQLLLDAKLDDKLELNEMDDHENHHAGLTHESLLSDQQRMVDEVATAPKQQTNGSNSISSSGSSSNKSNKLSLSDEDILASAIFLLMVGLETTATLLTNCSYALAFHPEAQTKLYEEVRKIADVEEVEAGGKATKITFDYDKLTACHYLDAVISETLRALSPVLMIDRITKVDYHVEKYDVTLPAGSKLQLAYHAIMNDPDLWPEPAKFRPERFLPGEREKIPAGAYCPFGLGPRHCLGMRFSLTEAKLALAKAIMRYEFAPAPDTSYPPRPKLSMGLNSPQKPLVTIQLRNS